MRQWARILGVMIAATLPAACGNSNPASPAPATTQVQVGVSGGGGTLLAPGETRQLFAVSTATTGSTTDVTNAATWQSSNPALATVSSGGLLTAAAEGDVDISATYQNVRGSLRTEIRRPSCAVAISPSAVDLNAFGGPASANVSVTPADCRWTAEIRAPWLSVSYDPGRPGDGVVSYTLPGNSTTEVRGAALVVTTATGSTATQQITQGRPVGCSYVVRPESATFTAAGGHGSFDVITTPGDCQWRATSTLTAFSVFVVNGFSGTGAGRVTYSVGAHTRSVDVDGFIEISGLSGLNPPGQHRVTVQKR